MLNADAYAALWTIWSHTGIRPEWLLGVLYHESGLNPAATNGSYHGIGQNSPGDIQTFAGVDVNTYLGWSAADQLKTVVLGYFARIPAPVRSGIRVYQAEFLPATLTTKTSLRSVIASATYDPSGFYRDNPSLDANGDGKITLNDLGAVVRAGVSTKAVRAAIGGAYLHMPLYAGPPTDPVYGNDFGWTAGNWVLAGAFGAALYGAWKLLPRR